MYDDESKLRPRGLKPPKILKDTFLRVFKGVMIFQYPAEIIGYNVIKMMD